MANTDDAHQTRATDPICFTRLLHSTDLCEDRFNAKSLIEESVWRQSNVQPFL
jgi:hypothetical protein